jgi:hypothetical protein
MSRIEAILLAGAAVASLAACGRGGAATERDWAERKAAAEQLELWSIEATGSGAPPVRICTDVAMRGGFVKPSPAVGDAPCTLIGRPVQTASNYNFRCELGFREWAVTSYWQGDRSRDFTDAVLVTSLDPPPGEYAQTRRFRKLGPCPAGWAAGDAFDRQGRRVTGLGPWPATASPPP